MVADDQYEETVSKKMHFLLIDEYFFLTYFLIGAEETEPIMAMIQVFHFSY